MYETYQTGFQFEGLGPSLLGGLRGWGRGQKYTFSEYGHVAYQIKADDASSNMVANILPTDTLDPGGGVKLYIFLKVVMLHIKSKLTTLAANILPTHTLDPGGGVKRSNYIFF